MAAGFAFDILILFWKIAVLNIFFREIRPRGAWNIPKTGAVLFICAPHANQFLDPLLLFTEVRRESGRRTSILTAAKSMDRKFIGFIARLFNSIPVSRAADYAKSGAGRVILSDDDPLCVRGVGTKFMSEAKLRGQIVLPKSAGYATGNVDKIISDTELHLKSQFSVPSKDGNSNIKATGRVRAEMLSEQGLEYKVLPHVDQDQTYGAVFDALNKGGSIGIFPEGGSHDRTDFLPLKAGFSIMALGAMANNPDLEVKLVPVGLSYFHAHKFRSRAVVEFGAPIGVTPDLVDMYKAGGPKKREACGKLLEQVHDALRAVTLRAPDWETLQVVQAARRLYRAPGQHLTIGQTVQLSKYFMEGYLKYKDEPRVVDLRERVIKYNRQLRDMGIADHQLERASHIGVHSLALILYRVGLLLWWTMLALPGTILHAPVFILAKVISHQKAKEALAASSVKIQGRDVLATWKVLVSLAVTPLLYLIYSLLTTIVAYHYDLAPKWRHWMPVVVFAALPGLGYAALKFGEAGMDVLKSLRPLFQSLIPGNHREVQKLQTQREEITNEINALVAEFGPKMYENFDGTRLMPQATSPRGSNPAGDNSVLSHPVAWLDNRIFGWSRRGSASLAWKGDNDPSRSPRSEPSSAPGSPHESDDEMEADVDYDDVLAVYDTGRHGRSTPRKRAGRSYSDLAQLRAQTSPEVVMDPLTVDTSAPDVDIDEPSAEGLHHRKPYNSTKGNGASADEPAVNSLGLDKGE